MWDTYYNGRSKHEAWGYFINEKEVLTVQKTYDGRVRINIFNKKGEYEQGWWEQDFEIAKIKALIKAKELGWKIKEIMN